MRTNIEFGEDCQRKGPFSAGVGVSEKQQYVSRSFAGTPSKHRRGAAVSFCNASTQCEPLGDRAVRHGLRDGQDSGCSADTSVASVVVSTVLGSSANE